MVRGIGTASVGLTGAALIGCGGDDDSSPGATTAPGGTTATGGTTAGTDAPAGTPQRGGTYERAMEGLVPNLDIHKTNSGAQYWDWVGNYLVRNNVNEPGTVEADIAELPETPDDLTFVFKINPAAKWQQREPVNGRAVTSEDVRFTFEDIKSADTASPRAGNYTQVESIETPDDQTVTFHMTVPKPDLLVTIADQYDFIYPHEWATNRPELTTNPAEVVGTGPYEMADFRPDTGWSVTRRADDYWKPDTAWLDGANYRILPDPESQVSALRSDDLHGVVGPVISERRDEIAGEGFQITESVSPNRFVSVLNHNIEPFNDPRVRLAMSRVINRRQMFELVEWGAGTISGAISPALDRWVLPYEELRELPGYLEDREADVAEAHKLMAASGFPDGFETAITTLSGRIQAMDTVLAPMYRELNINATLQDVGPGGAFAIVQIYREGTFEIGGFYPVAGAYPDAQLVIYHHSDYASPTNDSPIGSRNFFKYVNEEVDDLVLRQSQIFDYEERRELVYEVQRIVAREPGPLWVGSRHDVLAHASNVNGYVEVNMVANHQISHNVWFS